MDDFKPSVFTPFARRFTDEKARDLEDTKQLYQRVRALHQASVIGDDGAHVRVARVIGRQFVEGLPEPAAPAFGKALYEVLGLEKTIFVLPEMRWEVAHLSLKELVDLRHFLRSKEYFHTHEEKMLDLLVDCLARIFGAIGEALPKLSAPSPFSVPLVYALAAPKDLIDGIFGELWKRDYVDNGLFVDVSQRMFLNLCEISGIADPREPKKPFKLASTSQEPLHEIVEQYFKGTPFRDLFLTPVPLRFTHEDRFNHMHVVGGSGAGKTQLLQSMILNDLQSDDPPSLVVVDGQGDLIDKLLHLDLFNPRGDGINKHRLTLITPRDIKFPPALNVFDLNRERLGTYDEEKKEQIVAGAIQTFDYLFSGLLGADLTAKQSVFFKFAARLMLALPETMGRNATILDILNLLETPEAYREAIASLPPIQRNFFERDLLDPKKGTFKETREQIRYRLNAILENPTFARLFTAPETKIDLFKTLNSGGVILVDTAKAFLKDASPHFGRIFIALVLQAIQERAAIPEDERKPTFLIVDEAGSYFDSNIDDFLTEARKYKCGCIFAHQYLDQATWTLRSSLATNTSIKFVSHVSNNDARALAPDLRTTAEFIQSQPKLHFAAHFRDVTPNAVSIPVPAGGLEREPRMDDEDYAVLRELNRKRVSIPEPARSAPVTMKGPGPSKDDERPEPKARARGPSAAPPDPPKAEPTDDPTAASEDW